MSRRSEADEPAKAREPTNVGGLLLKAGVISAEQLQAAVEYQERSGEDLTHALFALGFIDDRIIAKLLARRYDLPWIDLDRHRADPEVVQLLPAETVTKHQVFPLAADGRVLTLAMADPTNSIAVDDIACMTGCKVAQVVAAGSSLKAAIDRHYGSSRLPEPEDGVSAVPRESDLATGPVTVAVVPPPTVVVWTLVAVNTAVFGLELLWGGSDWGPTLYRMGAGIGRAGLADEPWRIVSAAFLHVNAIHLAMNMWALVVFGRLLERMLGAERLIVLYVLSAAGGGLASSLAHAQTLSAGASGAVWGLMTAQIAILLRLKWLYGASHVPVRTWLLLQPLVVNLLISLLPFVDLAAHLGGGAVGAGLVLSGLVWGPRPAPAWRPAAWGASLAMAGCLAVALAQGRPWELRWPPPLVPRAIAGTPITVPVPRGLDARTDDEESVAFGHRLRDPLVLYCEARQLDAPCPDPQRRACLSKTARDFAAKPVGEGWSEDQPPRVVQLRSRPAVFYALRSPNGSRQMTWLMLEGTWWLRLDVLLDSDAAASWAELASSIADGIAIRAE